MQEDIIQDISILYELSLSMGKSMDLEENCKNFLEVLLHRKSFSFASVWVCETCLTLKDTNRFKLIYATPDFYSDERMLRKEQLVPKEWAAIPFFSLSKGHPDFSNFIVEHTIEEGHFAFIRLDEIGYLKLYANQQTSPFSRIELTKLLNVCQKFTNIIKGSISQQLQKRLLNDSLEKEDKIRKIAKFPEENPNPIIRTTKTGAIEYANASSTALLSALGIQKRDLFPDFIRMLILDAWRKKESVTEEITVEGKSWILQISPFPRDNFAYLYFNDISKLKQAHLALKASETKTRAIINAALDAVISIDQEGRIIEWNQRAKEIFGWEMHEVFGQTISSIIIPEKHRQAHTKGMERFMRTGYGPVLNKRIEIEAQHKEGHTFPVELAISPIKLSEGGTYIFSAFVRDISERKEMETKRERLMVELEKANKYLSDFAHVVSHDLKEPLRSISTLASWIQEDNEEYINEEGKEHFSMMVKNIVLMEELIEGVLSYSKLGKSWDRMEEIDVKEFLKEMVKGFAVPSHISVDLTCDFPAIYFNPIHLRQVFQNLLSNAIKYNDKQQGIVRFGVKDKGEYWEFFVEDNGRGIEEKYFEKIFQIFQSLDKKKNFESSGIGLSIVKKIVEIYGGRIWVRSKVGVGTSFYFSIYKENFLSDSYSF